MARIIREGGQPATTAFRVLSATPDSDLSGHGAPALLVDPRTRSLPWTTLGASQAIPLRCAMNKPNLSKESLSVIGAGSLLACVKSGLGGWWRSRTNGSERMRISLLE